MTNTLEYRNRDTEWLGRPRNGGLYTPPRPWISGNQEVEHINPQEPELTHLDALPE